MLLAVPYRGPDGMQARAWGEVGLGHAKLAVTPEDETEQQPLISPRTGCVVVADVRLDNRAELLGRLPGPARASIGDAELILRAYEAWGTEVPRYLLGDFAFVVWDPRSRRLFCARDTGGQRSLFYRSDPRTFAAASEIHQLLQDESVRIAPDEGRIHEWLLPLNMSRNEKDSPRTFYEGISNLPAGHALTVDQHGVRVWRYWELTPPAELRYRSDAEYAEHFRALFSEVVRARLRTSRPLGALLSGGLDSSSVVCTAQEVIKRGEASPAAFVTFSMVFDGVECDERHLIRDIEEKYGIDARYIAPEHAADGMSVMGAGFRERPTPPVGGVSDAYRVASQAGVRVLLSGEVADSCIQGSRFVFDSLIRSGQLGLLAQHFRAYRRVSQESLRRTVAMHVVAPLLPLWLQKQAWTAVTRRNFRRFRRRLLPSWLTEALREDLSERHHRLCLEQHRHRRFSNDGREAESIMLYPPEVGISATGWPLEIWRPFADRRLHELLLAVPPEQKFRPHPGTDSFYAGSKWLLRRAMRGIVPGNILTRTEKTSFGALWQQEIERNWPRYQEAFGPTARPEVVARGYVDQHPFWLRLEALRSTASSEGYGADFLYVTRVIGLETWLRSLSMPRSQATRIQQSADLAERTQPRPLGQVGQHDRGASVAATTAS
jgi:asparagine synthase (glutamine-hydrolysing)